MLKLLRRVELGQHAIIICFVLAAQQIGLRVLAGK